MKEINVTDTEGNPIKNVDISLKKFTVYIPPSDIQSFNDKDLQITFEENNYFQQLKLLSEYIIASSMKYPTYTYRLVSRIQEENDSISEYNDDYYEIMSDEDWKEVVQIFKELS
jgi:hypothetical protein